MWVREHLILLLIPQLQVFLKVCGVELPWQELELPWKEGHLGLLMTCEPSQDSAFQLNSATAWFLYFCGNYILEHSLFRISCEYVLHVICKFSSKPIEFNSVEVGGHLCRYAGGLLLAYMVFVPLCEAGSIDGPSLQAS